MGSTSTRLLGLQGTDERFHPSLGQGERQRVDQRLLSRVSLEGRFRWKACYTEKEYDARDQMGLF